MLVERIEKVLLERSLAVGFATHARHRAAMESARRNLNEVELILLGGPDQYDIAAAELRSAIRALEVLVGRVDVENLLDEIFSSFCVGK